MAASLLMLHIYKYSFWKIVVPPELCLGIAEELLKALASNFPVIVKVNFDFYYLKRLSKLQQWAELNMLLTQYLFLSFLSRLESLN